MRLIDANEFEDELDNTEYDISPAYEPDGYSHKLICEVLERTPTVDAVPGSDAGIANIIFANIVCKIMVCLCRILMTFAATEKG